MGLVLIKILLFINTLLLINLILLLCLFSKNSTENMRKKYI